MHRASPKVKGEVAVTEGFAPFKVPGSPVVDKTVFPSPLSHVGSLFSEGPDVVVVVFFHGVGHFNINNQKEKIPII